MKDYDRRIRQGGDDAIAAVSELLAAGDRLESQLVAVALERDRLRLTDAEREAVRFCSELARMGDRGDLAATLRGLLERLK